MNSEYRKSERGSAGTKFVAVLAVMFLIGHAGYNYIPVAYQGTSFKQDMQTAVVNGVSMPGINKSAVDVVKDKIAAAMRSNDIPANAFVDVKQMGNVVQAHVKYSKDVNILPFGMYKYSYNFDNTATPTGFLLQQ